MSLEYTIPAPLLFNPLKHHLGYIRNYVLEITDSRDNDFTTKVIKELRHIGGSVMDLYSGALTHIEICDEFLCHLTTKKLNNPDLFSKWVGTGPQDFKTIYLTDGSQWIMKYHDNDQHFVHIYPARFSPHTFRIKANTLKSAILYQLFIGKAFVTEEGLNTARAIAGLSPVKDVFDTQAITEMIEMLIGK
jgi:hypothetical protein